MFKKLINNKYSNLKISDLSLSVDKQKKYKDVINLSIGNPDFLADKDMLTSAFNYLIKNDYTKYTDFRGDEDLINKTISMYNANINHNNILITHGGTNAMRIVFEAILNKDDEVIVIAPFYADYKYQIDMSDAVLVEYKTKIDNNYEIDITELEKLVTEKTKLLIVNSPNNPTGKVYSEKILKEILNLSIKYNFLIISDDIYQGLNYTNNTKTFLEIEKEPNRIITIYSYSKDYSIPGLRLGHIIANKYLINIMKSISEVINFTISSYSQRVGYEAIKNRERIKQAISTEYKNRIDYAYKRLKKLKNINLIKPDGAFYLFVNIKNTGLTDKEITEYLFDKAHIIVLAGSNFYKDDNSYIRIACCVGINKLKIAFDRIEKLDIFI